MRRRERLLALGAVLVVVLAFKVGQELFRWYRYAEERAELQALSAELEEAGLEVVRTQLRADSLRDAIEAMDRALADAQRAVAAYDRHAVGGALPAALYEPYRAELDAYNRRVAERNARFAEWREVVDRNHAVVGRYNRLADSIRVLAGRIGEPYYAIPSPAEVALEHGLIREDP